MCNLKIPRTARVALIALLGVIFTFRSLEATDPWFDQGIPENSPWVYSSTLGFVYTANKPWFFTPYMGWFYFPESHRSQGFGWMPATGWFWSSPESFSYLYSYDRQAWVLADLGSTDSAWFWDTMRQEWFSHSWRERPNIVLITADDLGLQLGAYGDPVSITPNLDRLASDGLLYERAYVTTPSCSSSRSSILTGLYPHTNGQIGLVDAGFSMRPGVTGLPRMLNNAGYATGIIGKLHVEPTSAIDFSWFSSLPHGQTRDVNMVSDQVRYFVTQQAAERPFFLMVNYLDPHRDFVDQYGGLPERVLGPDDVEVLPHIGLDTPAIRELVAEYYNCVQRVDLGVAKIRQVLDETGLTDNTIIIFVGDHGPPFSHAKTTLYEAGTQIPMILYWPRGIAAGRREASLTSTVDIVPTLLNLAQLPVPADLPGHSLVRQFRPRIFEFGAPRKYLFTEYFYHSLDHYYPRRAVRDERFKLIHNLDWRRENPLKGIIDNAYGITRSSDWDGTIIQDIYTRLVNPPEYELYDLEQDPYERYDLSKLPEHRAKLRELTQALDNWSPLESFMRFDPKVD